MKKQLLSLFGILLLFVLFSLPAYSQGTPEILWYRFNGTGTTVPNLASNPPSGTTTASLNGAISQGSTGTCSGTALVGSGTTSTTDYVNTGWATSTTGSWTVSFWTKDISSSSTLFYIWGDNTAGSLRCFTNGVAGANNWIVRGPFTDVLISGAATTSANVSTVVYDSAAGQLYAYLNGTLVNTVTQSTPITLSGTGPFKVCGYGSNVGLPANGLMDEFRFYKRALKAAEVAKLVYSGNTTNTLNVSICANSYKSPSGKFTWTTSGSHKDTLPNEGNCDSIITVNLTLKKATASTITPSVCNSYKSPSGKYTWTNSGAYKDTIPNTVGCDSVISITLTINKPTTSTQSITACNSYTSPSGKYVWTTSASYKDTIPNTNGCDSLMTINLTINTSNTGIFFTTACDKYTSPSGKYTWTSTGVYLDTIPNAKGCDSVITISVAIKSSNSSTVTTTACNTYTSPSGKYTWTTSGTYADTIPNVAICDSVITINLTVNSSNTGTFTTTACTQYMGPSGKYTWTTSGIYMDTIPNTASCDSVITLTLTINNNTTSSISPSACLAYTSPSGKHVWTSSGPYTDTIPNTNGCDSVISINLTVVPVDVTVTRSNFGFTLNAGATSATYQWLNCSTNAQIPSATAASYTVTANGSYAVEVTQNSCKDTSTCIVIGNVGIQEPGIAGRITLYPNPTGGNVVIAVTEPFENATIRLINIAGKTIQEVENVNGYELQLDMANIANGIYFVEVMEKGTIARLKLIKF